MAQRKRIQRPPKAPPDLGTPETRAKLRPPPWAHWYECASHPHNPHEYARAAQEIALAFGLLTAGLFARAFEIGKITGRIAANSDGQERAIHRYTAWRGGLRPLWHLAVVLDLVVDARPGNAAETAIVRDSLDLYLKMFPIPLDRRAERGEDAA